MKESNNENELTSESTEQKNNPNNTGVIMDKIVNDEGQLSSSNNINELTENQKTQNRAPHKVDARKISSSINAKNMKDKKLSRLKDERNDYKRTLKRGYYIVSLSGAKSSQKKLTSLDKFSIKAKIKHLDIEIFETQNEIQDIRVDTNILLKKNIKNQDGKLANLKIGRRFYQITRRLKGIITSNLKGSKNGLPSSEDDLQSFFSKLPKPQRKSLEADKELESKVINEINRYLFQD